MRSTGTFKRAGFVMATLAVTGTVYACTRDAHPTGPVTTTFSSRTATRGGENSSDQITASKNKGIAHANRRAEAERKLAWVGAVHNEIIRDFIANRDQWVGRDLSNDDRVCGGLVRLVQKYAPRVNQLANLSRSASEDRRLAVEAVRALRKECGTAVTMSVFDPLRTFSALAQTQGDELTGAADEHISNFISAIEGSDGSVATVAAAGNIAINNASGIPQADFEKVVAVVTVADSSAHQWNSYASTGGFGPIDLAEPMSVFKAAFPWLVAIKVAFVVASDAIGCRAGYEGGGGWGGCVNWGGAGSAVSAMGVMMK